MAPMIHKCGEKQRGHGPYACVACVCFAERSNCVWSTGSDVGHAIGREGIYCCVKCLSWGGSRYLVGVCTFEVCEEISRPYVCVSVVLWFG